MILLLVLRRLSPRGRKIFGVVLMALGAAVLAASAALSVNLYVHGAILMVLGAACYVRAGARDTAAGRAHNDGYGE